MSIQLNVLSKSCECLAGDLLSLTCFAQIAHILPLQSELREELETKKRFLTDLTAKELSSCDSLRFLYQTSYTDGMPFNKHIQF